MLKISFFTPDRQRGACPIRTANCFRRTTRVTIEYNGQHSLAAFTHQVASGFDIPQEFAHVAGHEILPAQPGTSTAKFAVPDGSCTGGRICAGGTARSWLGTGTVA